MGPDLEKSTSHGSAHPLIGLYLAVELQYSLPTKSCQNEKLPKNVQKMSQNAFWDFLAASQKNVQKVSGKCPGAGAGAGKMSRKCQKSVPQTFSRHFFDTFWQIERWRPSAATQKGARAPPFGSLFAKKCQKSIKKVS